MTKDQAEVNNADQRRKNTKNDMGRTCSEPQENGRSRGKSQEKSLEQSQNQIRKLGLMVLLIC